MKKLSSIILAICLCVLSVGCCVGCNDRNEKPFVDTSNAVECGSFDRSDYAKEMELVHDAEREHIEIPDGAETVEIDGEEFIPIDTLDSMGNGGGKNYILTCDQYLTGTSPLGGGEFRGKLNGNNYKISGTVQTAIIFSIEDSEIFNIVLSHDLTLKRSRNTRPAILVNEVYNSLIYNIKNYSRTCSESHAIVGALHNSEMSNCENYADLHSYGAIVGTAWGTSKIINCKNYGNVSINSTRFIGGIVGRVIDDIGTPYRADVTIEKCINYGHIIGSRNVGGIVGDFVQIDFSSFTDIILPVMDNQTKIKDCQNFGNIYRDKGYEERPADITVISCFGGIAGVFPNLESCTNQGNIYGFEALNPKWQVEYIGGITGVAVSVENCVNTGTVDCSDNVRFADEICGCYIKTSEVI